MMPGPALSRLAVWLKSRVAAIAACRLVTAGQARVVGATGNRHPIDALWVTDRIAGILLEYGLVYETEVLAAVHRVSGPRYSRALRLHHPIRPWLREAVDEIYADGHA